MMAMKLSITYLDRNITQILDVIDHAEYHLFKAAKEIDNDAKQFETLSLEQQDNVKQVLNEFAWLGQIIKNNSYCTTKSPIFNSLHTGELILPEHQGGIHKVITFICSH
jgi:hypothetical protein